MPRASKSRAKTLVAGARESERALEEFTAEVLTLESPRARAERMVLCAATRVRETALAYLMYVYTLHSPASTCTRRSFANKISYRPGMRETEARAHLTCAFLIIVK